MSRTIKAAFAALLASAALAVSLAPSAAAEPTRFDRVVHVRVSYADLDIGNEAGAKTLMRRIETAAERACGGMSTSRQLRMNNRIGACRTEAISNAVAGVGAPQLSALLAQRPVRFASR
jgi:UrcA family protein